MLTWFANPNKLANFLSFSWSQRANLNAIGLANQGYYLRSLFYAYYTREPHR